jgi:hypothetical protein
MEKAPLPSKFRINSQSFPIVSPFPTAFLPHTNNSLGFAATIAEIQSKNPRLLPTAADAVPIVLLASIAAEYSPRAPSINTLAASQNMKNTLLEPLNQVALPNLAFTMVTVMTLLNHSKN